MPRSQLLRIILLMSALSMACQPDEARHDERPAAENDPASKPDDPSAVCSSLTHECSQALQPYVCDGDEPSYDCERCGCPGEQTCFEGVCYAPDIPPLESTTPTLQLGLPVDDYFEFFDYHSEAPAITYDELVELFDSKLAADRVVNSVLIGESHGSADEQAVGLGLIRELASRGWQIPSVGIEGDTPIIDVEPLADLGVAGHAFGGDLTNEAHCADLISAVAGSTNEDAVYVQYTGSGHTSQEVCHHDTLWPVCDLPHVSECALREGRRALTLILFDPNIWLWNTDRLLFWGLPEVSDRSGFDAALEENIARWSQSFESQPLAPEFETTVEGRGMNVRIVAAANTDDVYVAYFPRPGRKPYSNMVYRAAWSDSELQDYIVENGLHPKRCIMSWDLSPEAPSFTLRCKNDDKEIEAHVDGTTFELVDSAIIDNQSIQSPRSVDERGLEDTMSHAL